MVMVLPYMDLVSYAKKTSPYRVSLGLGLSPLEVCLHGRLKCVDI